MYPTTGYTPGLDHATLECNKYAYNLEKRGRERAVIIAEKRIAYLLEIGHADTARALKEMVDG